jgi:hypothetical protein
VRFTCVWKLSAVSPFVLSVKPKIRDMMRKEFKVLDVVYLRFLYFSSTNDDGVYNAVCKTGLPELQEYAMHA